MNHRLGLDAEPLPGDLKITDILGILCRVFDLSENSFNLFEELP
jgi:hypothetical protein